MSTSKYIRPMSFREILGAMFRLYWKIFIPILILNIVVDYLTVGIGLIFGIFVGPVLLMTSNAILGKRVKVWQSIKKGVTLGNLFKIGFYILLFLLICLPILSLIYSSYVIVTLYIFLTPLWVFVPMIMLLEKRGLGASIKRSFQVIRNNFSRILTMTFFLIILGSIIGALASALIADWDFGWLIGFAVFSALGLNVIPYVFVYYEYRARAENFSEELLSQELGLQTMDEMMAI